MRRRIPYRVCRCLPNGIVTHLEARLLKDLVNREIHPIRCAESCKRKFQKAMYIGDLCAETGHFWWARKIWRFASGLIEDKDYNDWRHVWFDNNRVRLRDVISETECELCKAKLPDLIFHNKKLYSLLDFSEDFKNYLILECLTLDKENNKFLYIISLEKKGDIKIGRGQICDILFSDASVSRIHCVLSVEGKNVFLKDYGSKFGTLILIQTPIINLTENLPLFIQIGRSFLNFLATDANPKFFNCCGVSEKPMISYYYQQNQKKLRDNRIFTVKTEGNTEESFNNEEKKEENKKLYNQLDKSDEKIKVENDNDNESEIIVDINEDVNKRGDIYEEINDEMNI